MTRSQILLPSAAAVLRQRVFTIAKPAVTHFPPLFMMLIVYAGLPPF